MSHITARTFAVGVAALTPLLLGGTTTTEYSPEQERTQLAMTTVMALPLQKTPVELRGEIPNTGDDSRTITLGKSENLSDTLGEAVRELEISLTDGEVSSAVAVLEYEVKMEAAVASLTELQPGVTMTVYKNHDSKGQVVWDIYIGKYSGIQQEG